MAGPSQGREAGITELTPSSVPEWLFLDLNSYFASVEQQENPRLRGKPLAVVPVLTDSTCAIAASYQAKAFGIKTGTMIGDAKQMCPKLICVLANHDLYVEYHHKIVEEINRHIEVTITASIDEVACKLELGLRDPVKAVELAKRIKQGLARNIGPAITCNIGIAPNRYLAKVASDMQKPDGLVVIEAKDLPHRLFGLKLNDLPGVGQNMERRLRGGGILTMEQLLTSSRARLRQVWGGVEGERLYYKLRGVDLPDVPTQRSSVGHSHVLAPELRPPHMAEMVAHRLVLKVGSRLRRMKYQAQQMDVSVRIEKGPRVSEGIRFAPANDSSALLKQLNILWARIRNTTGTHPLKKVSVTVTQLVSLEGLQQMELFEKRHEPGESPVERRQRLSEAIDVLNKRFGRDTVALGMLPKSARGFSGTKVAFTRIPSKEEFHE
ncbi:MAG TPA: impB/mucB/samB family protein [Verrucomicrobiae bacterium]